MTITLLGPQRLHPSLGATVRALGGEGVVATVTAGWQERENDDAELDAVLDGRSHNLALYRRWLDVLATDGEYAEAERQLHDQLDELRELYEVRLDHALRAVAALQRAAAPPQLQAAAIDDAIEEVRRLDRWHLHSVATARAAFDAEAAPANRPIIRGHRDDVAERLGGCSTLAIAGGHVGVLLECLRLFDLTWPAERALVAWSAGAMALSDRIVLFHDFVAQGHGRAEVLDAGLGFVHGVVALPHARRRLQLRDAARASVLARRFAPARCLVLDDGVRVDVEADGALPAGARVLTPDGAITALEAA